MFPPHNLQRKCGSCATSFNVCHRLSCRKWGLVIAIHNEVGDKFLYLSQLAFHYACVWDEPFIHQSHIIWEGDIRQGSDRLDTRGDVLIWEWWKWQTDYIINVKLGNADADTYRFEPMDNILARWEKANKDKNGKQCYEQQKYFHPFVLSVDCILGKEDLAVLANLSQLMAEKMDEPIFHVRGWINSQTVIGVVMSYSQTIRGSQLPSPLWDWEPDWDPASGLRLVQ